MTASGGVVPGPALFLVWGPQSYGTRSRWFANQLGIPLIHVTATERRGALVAPYKYIRQGVTTARLLAARRPRTVFFQSPPTIGPLIGAVYGALSGSQLVVDAHTSALTMDRWTRPFVLYRWLARRTTATVVTNEDHARRIEARGGTSVVVPAIPAEFETDDAYQLETNTFNVVVVCTHSRDEPLRAVVDAARTLDEVTFHLTGRPRKSNPVGNLPDNVVLTGFLSEPTYYGLLRRAHAVMCLTTRDNTMQNGAVEALSLGRPIITSDWPLLRSYFRLGSVHVDNTSRGIASGVRLMLREHPRLASEIVALRSCQQEIWQEGLARLSAVLAG